MNREVLIPHIRRLLGVTKMAFLMFTLVLCTVKTGFYIYAILVNVIYEKESKSALANDIL